MKLSLQLLWTSAGFSMLSCQYGNSHYKDKAVSWPSHLYDGNPGVFILNRPTDDTTTTTIRSTTPCIYSILIPSDILYLVRWTCVIVIRSIVYIWRAGPGLVVLTWCFRTASGLVTTVSTGNQNVCEMEKYRYVYYTARQRYTRFWVV